MEVSELCRREGVNPALYYQWKKKLLTSAEKVFGNSEERSNREERLEAELQRKNEVIAEITTENLDLKKGLSG